MSLSRLGLFAGSCQHAAAKQLGFGSCRISAHVLRPQLLARCRAGGQLPAQQSYSSTIQAATDDSSAASEGQQERPVQFEFDDSWVNRVGVTGKVLKGPKLNHYYVRNKYKAVMVLGLYGQSTGDPFLDMPRTVLVEAWNAQAQALHEQIKIDDVIYLSGHLAYDYRRKHRFEMPILALRADAWSMIDLASVPADKKLPEYAGEFDAAFDEYKPKATPSTDANSQSDGRRRRNSTSSGGSGWKAEALQMLQQGQPLSEIAAHFNYQETTVSDGLIQAALAEGYQSSSWPKLLEYLGLAGPNALNPAVVFDAVGAAIDRNTAPLTKEGKVRLSAIKEYLRSDACTVAELIKQREKSAAGDQTLTYGIIKVMVGLREMGGNPSMLQS